MAHELLPCPFCGATSRLDITYDFDGRVVVVCDMCDAVGPPQGDGSLAASGDDIRRAAQRWNTRYVGTVAGVNVIADPSMPPDTIRMVAAQTTPHDESS